MLPPKVPAYQNTMTRSNAADIALIDLKTFPMLGTEAFNKVTLSWLSQGTTFQPSLVYMLFFFFFSMFPY